MKKIRLPHRILAMVLVILMTVQLLPLNAFAAFGNLQSWDPGVDLSTLKQEDAINWPIKVYDYLSDGMLFEWMDTNTTTSSSSPALTYGHTDGTAYIAPYGGGYKPPATVLGSDFTYSASANLSSSNYNSPYYYSGSGCSVSLTKKDAVDFKSPYYLRISDNTSYSGSGGNHNMLLNYFSTDKSTNSTMRYMVMVYRANKVEDYYCSISLSDDTGGTNLWDRNQVTIPDSSDWTYVVFDTSKFISSSIVQWVWLTFHTTASFNTSYKGMNSGAYLDLTHVGYFSNLDEANNYGAEAVKFDKNPGEYLAHSSTTTYTHSYVTPVTRGDYLNNIFSLSYCWKNKDTTPKMFDAASNTANVRYGMDFTTHSTANGWKTNAYTSDTFWGWSNGTSLSLKNTVNNVTKAESFSMSKIEVEQHTQSNGAQFVRLTNNGLSKILLSKFREDHQTVQEGYVPLTADVDYMVMVYRPNGMDASDRIGLWAHGYLDSSSTDSHKTAGYWKYAGLTKAADWTTAANVNQLTIAGQTGWQYKIIPLTETIGLGDSNMTSIDRLANVGLYLPKLTDGKSLDIAYVAYFKNNPSASDGDQYEAANTFGTNAVNYMNAAPKVTQDINTSKTYTASRKWYGGGNKSFGMLYSSGGGEFLPSGNSGGDSTGTNEYYYGYEFDTWMIGYRTNAGATNSFNTARYNLVYNSTTGQYEKVKFTANYTPTGTGSGHDNSAFQYSATGTTNNIYFVAATEEDAEWGSNDGDTTNGQDFDFTNVPFDGYQLLQNMTAGVMTAGLLEGGLQTVTVNGVKYRVPSYRQETVEYIAYNLLYGLRVPMKNSSGDYNTRYIKGTESTKFGGVDLNGDGVIGKIDYDGDSRNGAETDEASVDLATALRHELGLSPRLGNSVNVMSTSAGVDATHATFIQQMGNYEETYAKRQMLFGEFSDCRNAIDTAMDAAYYLLNNIFISNSYNQQQDDYDYLTLSSATVNALGHSGYAYVFDAGFTTGSTTDYGEDFTDDGTNKSAVNYSPYGSEGGTGTISMEGVTGKTRFDYGTSSISWTTRFPFLPITDAEGDFAGQTESYYFLDDAQRVYTEGSNSYKDRNFNYVIASNGEFVYREEDDLFFEFEGDDDVYLFINGELVLDIGGAHSITSIYIDVNDYVNAAATALSGLAQYGYHKDMSIDQFDEWISASTLQRLDADLKPTGETIANPFSADEIATFKRQHRLNLSDGQICQFDFYYMERHGWGANMRIVTNMHITDPALAVDKSAYQFDEEIEYGGVIDPTSSVEYNFKLVNTGNTKLYNLTWSDSVLGITMDPTNGLVVGKNPDGLEMNGIYVMNASGGYLQAKDLYVRVTGDDVDGNSTDFIVTFDEENNDGGQAALKRFLAKLESNDGTQSGYDDAEVTNAGSGLWVGGSVTFGGIYYMLTPKQTEARKVDNTVYLTATTKTDPTAVGNRTLRSDASHLLYTNGFPIHYQWAGHNIFMNLEHLLEQAKIEAEKSGSQLSLYQQFFEDVTLDNLYTQPCDKFGRVGGDYTAFLNAYTDKAGHSGYLINYAEPGIYTFHLLMYMKTGKNKENVTTTFASSGVNASDIGDGYYAILRSQVFVADVEDSVYVLDYGLSTQSLDANGALFKNDYLFGPYGTIRAKLMGITGSAPSFRDPKLQTDATKTGISFNAVESNRINTPDGFYNANLAIPEGGKDIAYDSNTGEYTLTGVGTMKISAVLPTDGKWDMPYLYYWYDDGVTGPSWPGTPMKKLGAGNFELDIPADVTNVIINNGSAALKTADLKITPGLESTITVSVDSNNVVDAHIETIMEEVTMHVKVPSDWENVYLHHWHDNGESTEFPGDELTEVDSNGYYVIKLHGDVTNLLINDGANRQSGDLKVYAGKEAWIEVSDTVTGTVEGEDGTVTTYYDSLVKYTLSEGYVVHASVPAGWKDNVYLYYWHEGMTDDAMTWPGVKMTKGDAGWYTYDGLVPAEITQLIINDGADGNNHQTVNLTVTPGLETWVMVQNETVAEGEHAGKYTAKIAYGSESASTGLTFTPKSFLDEENNMWMAITIHGANSIHSGLNEDIDIHNETQMYKKVTVLPATVVYYEDTFGSIEYDTTTGNSFIHHGNGSGTLAQSVDQNQIYGQDSAYQDSANELYSGDSMTAVQIVNDSKFATFTFNGTGFELIGRTNAFNSASMMARVYKASNYSDTAYEDYLAAAQEYRNQNNTYTYYNFANAEYQKGLAAYDNAAAAYELLVTAYNNGVSAYSAAAKIVDAAVAAEANLLAAEKTMNESKEALDNAAVVRDEALAAFGAASEDDENYTELENAYLAAEQAYSEAEQAYADSQAAYTGAEEAFSAPEQAAIEASSDEGASIVKLIDAQSAVQAAKTAMDNAEAAKDIAYAAYKATSIDEDEYAYWAAMGEYNGALTVYNEKVAEYNKAVKAYDAAYSVAVEADAAYVAAVQAYLDQGEATNVSYDKYSSACTAYQTALKNYETVMNTYLKRSDVVVVERVGYAKHTAVTKLENPSKLFELVSSTAPFAPSTWNVGEPVAPESPFVTVTPVFTQFDHGNDGGAESINQVPVIRVTGMDLDEYVVELAGIPTYIFDPNNNYAISGTKETYVYIDGLRIFQPMGATNDAYTDVENGAQINELRDLIASGKIAVGILENGALKISSGTTTWTEGYFDNDFSSSNKESYEGIKVDSSADYLIQGPNNEIYMEGNSSNSALVFYVQETDADIHELQIAVRGLDYGKYYGSGSTALNAQLQYGILMSDGTYAWKNLVRVVTGTEQYYSIPYTECPVDALGRYQIVLRAVNPETNANAMVSYTNMKLNGLEVVQVEGVGESTILYYQNGMLIRPQYELVIINSKFQDVDVIPFTGDELTMTLTQDMTYVYVRSTLGGQVYNYFAKSDPGAATSATMYQYDGEFTRYSLDIPKGNGDITLKIKQTALSSLELSYCLHEWDDGHVAKQPNCVEVGYEEFDCTKCGHIKTVELPTNDKHSYSGGICVRCGGQEPKYYLVGYINGANYGCDSDYTNMGKYLFVDGKLKVTFSADSYVFVKADGNAAWYMFNEYTTTQSGTLYNTELGSAEKMYVPNGLELTFTLVVNDDGTLTLSYTKPCTHNWVEGKVTAPTCSEAGEKTYTCSLCDATKTEFLPVADHTYENGKCSSCGEWEYMWVYFRKPDSWSTAYVYTWDNNTVQYMNAWPGTQMTMVTGNVYVCKVPTMGNNIIFNNGSGGEGNQTGDQTLPTDGTNLYDYNGGGWSVFGEAVSYYLAGYINGADYGCGDDSATMGIYKFVDGKLTVTFDSDSYVFVKTSGNLTWYMAQALSTDHTTTLYNNTTGTAEKIQVPGGVELTFVLTVNDDDTLTVQVHTYVGNVTDEASCTEDGEITYTCSSCSDSYTAVIPATGHNYVDGTCTNANCGEDDTRTLYFRNTEGWENVYIWAWTEGGANYTGGVWPGAQMTLVEGETDLYSYTLSVKAVSVIFNDGADTNQTGNLTIPTDGKCKYTYDAATWSTLDENPVVEEQILYLQPNANWNIDNARFAAYFFIKDTDKNVWVDMTDADGDGIYECVVPAGYTSVIFCRMNPGNNENQWGADGSHKWNQTSDLTVPTDGTNLCVITENAWDYDSSWSTYVPAGAECSHSYEEAVTTAATCTEAGVKTFTCSSCGDSYTEAIAATGHSYEEAVTTEATCTTAGEKNVTCSSCGDSSTETIPATGHSYASGVCTSCGVAQVLYLKPNANWNEASARFAAYFFGNGDTWVDMTDADGDGTYECVVPTNGYTSVIFCRMNPGTTDNNWDNKWNQSGDLTIPTNNNTLFTVPDGWWDGAGNEYWSAVSTYSLRSVRKLNADMYLTNNNENPINLPSVKDQLASDVVYGELDVFVPEDTENETVTENVKINSASLVLSDDIVMNYYVTVPENAEDVYMTFTFNGEVTLVTDYTVCEDGRYRFCFTGINPQKMGDNISAKVYATVNGTELTDSIEEYSVRAYCVNQLAKSSDEEFVRLISDLLVYGAKTQIRQDYKTDALVTDGLDLNPSTFPGLDDSFDKKSVTGEADANVAYTGVTVALGSKVMLRLTVTSADPSAYTFKINVNGVDTVYTADDLVEAGNGKYYLYFDKLKATSFDETVTATIEQDGQQLSQTVTYSVNSYILRYQNTDDAVQRELLEAIYNYGVSASACVN